MIYIFGENYKLIDQRSSENPKQHLHKAKYKKHHNKIARTQCQKLKSREDALHIEDIEDNH